MNGASNGFKAAAGGWVWPAAAVVALAAVDRVLTEGWPAYGQFPVLGALAVAAAPLAVLAVILRA